MLCPAVFPLIIRKSRIIPIRLIIASGCFESMILNPFIYIIVIFGRISRNLDINRTFFLLGIVLSGVSGRFVGVFRKGSVTVIYIIGMSIISILNLPQIPVQSYKPLPK